MKESYKNGIIIISIGLKNAGCLILLGENNLAGELSHPMTIPRVPVKYIDLLSRFEKNEEGEIKDQLLFILSGPEPQRTILENKIIDEVSHYPGTATIVRGLPSAQSVIPSTGMIKFYNHLSAKELSEEIEKADWVISRSGYSTMMDLAKLQKKSILIPTPGQTEQEYLAKKLWQKKIAFSVEQKEFSLDQPWRRQKNSLTGFLHRKFEWTSHSSQKFFRFIEMTGQRWTIS